ncbi:MAG: hypothetical protein ABEI54_01170 [Candidatus Bipolaricaulia bacterium]
MAKVISDNYPYLPIIFRIRGNEQSALAFIDTGFDGYLVIPEELESELGEEDYISKWELADGSFAVGPEYLGKTRIEGLDNSEISARITCIGDEFIVGREIIDEFQLVFDHGERVKVST